jgi:predicted AAA+ superfamily ATPase
LLSAFANIEEVLRQFNSLGAACEYSYYHTGAGSEADLMLEGDLGRVALDIKYASTINSRDLRGLHEFVGKYKARFGILITNDCTARVFDDNLPALPFNWLAHLSNSMLLFCRMQSNYNSSTV